MNSPRSFRPTELVKELARQGHKVTLLTFKNIHIPFEKEYNVTIKNLGKMIFPPVQIDKGNKLVKIIRWGPRRALELFFRYPELS